MKFQQLRSILAFCLFGAANSSAVRYADVNASNAARQRGFACLGLKDMDLAQGTFAHFSE